MEINIIDIVSIVTGVTGMMLGIFSFMMSRVQMVKSYYEEEALDDMRAARKKVYDYTHSYSEEKLLEDKEFAKVCSHYDFYGLMLRKHYLPKWVILGTNSIIIMRCYECSEQYIKLRKKENKYYCENFEWLYRKAKKGM